MLNVAKSTGSLPEDTSGGKPIRMNFKAPTVAELLVPSTAICVNYALNTMAVRIEPYAHLIARRSVTQARAAAMLLAEPLKRFADTMTVHTILKMGDPRLLRPAEPVAAFDTDELHSLVCDLQETMRAANGAGLAAPQIGVSLQLVLFGSHERNPRYPDRPLVPPTVLLNPVITPLGEEEEEDWEGCLSVPGLRGMVPRWKHIRYQGFDVYGNPIDRVAEGFHARVVQHECDHLWGKLYPMRMRDFTQFGYTEVLFPGIDAAEEG